MEKNTVLSIKDLEIQFHLRGKTLNVIRGVSLDVIKGETLAIVGESGCGKSVFTKSLMGLLDSNGSITAGSILYNDVDIAKYRTEKEWRTIRGGEIAMVLQDPMTSLNPLKTIGKQIQEAVELHQGVKGDVAKAMVMEYLRDVGITDPERRYSQYPHEFSGGMRQRVVIAIAVACMPKILICDEPTTALDVTIQAQILSLLNKLREKYKLTVIFITHDLGVVANVADRVVVMYAGDIIEVGNVDEIFFDPRHPYTWALLSSLPQLGVKGEDLYSIKGAPPNLSVEVKGDAFAPRNPHALKIDFVKRPPFFEVSPTHKARTWLLDPKAPKVEPPEFLSRIDSEMLGMKVESKQTEEKNTSVSDKKKEVLLKVDNLEVTFGSRRKKFVAVSDVNLEIYKGETFGLVGESGSGKTTIGRAIMRIYPTSNGDILYKGKKINGKISKELDRQVIREIQMIFQDPMASLNERAKVDYIVGEGLANTQKISKKEMEQKVQQALEEVGLLPEFASRFPHEFSGGQRQRIGIARTLVMQPEFIVADEPISALDVSIRAQVLNLLSKMKRERGLTYLFIAHDLSVMRFITDRIAVIHKGRIVELAETEQLFAHPLHPYTKALLSAIPMPNPQMEKKKKLIVYDPEMHEYRLDKPSWREVEPGHFIYANDAEFEKYQEELQS